MDYFPAVFIPSFGSEEDLRKNTSELIDSLEDKSGVILSCAGGMPPAVSTENLKEFLESAAKNL